MGQNEPAKGERAQESVDSVRTMCQSLIWSHDTFWRTSRKQGAYDDHDKATKDILERLKMGYDWERDIAIKFPWDVLKDLAELSQSCARRSLNEYPGHKIEHTCSCGSITHARNLKDLAPARSKQVRLGSFFIEGRGPLTAHPNVTYFTSRTDSRRK